MRVRPLSVLLLTSFRKRRVKCDEAKPVCDRCRSTGRTCDGYLHCQEDHSLTSHHDESPFICCGRRIAIFSVAPDWTYDERKAFDDFRFQFSADLSEPLGTEQDIWSRLILQMAFQEPSVKHAICALGSLRKPSLGDKLDRHHSLSLTLGILTQTIRKSREAYIEQNAEHRILRCDLSVLRCIHRL
jgi:hypothetical protein